MKIITLDPGPRFSSNCYVLISDGEAVVIDPSFPIQSVREKIGSARICGVILTHAHFDHMLFLDSFRNIPVYVGALDAPSLGDSRKNGYYHFLGEDIKYTGDYIALSSGNRIKFGGAELSVIETPGHTKGSVSLLTNGAVFVGDLVFADGGYGRTDLWGGSILELTQSIEKIMGLHESTLVYPGHGRALDVREIRRYFGQKKEN